MIHREIGRVFVEFFAPGAVVEGRPLINWYFKPDNERYMSPPPLNPEDLFDFGVDAITA